MKKLLITGFDPFGGESINPSWEAVRRMDDEIAGYSLTKIEIPTVFEKGAKTILDAAEKIRPDVILMIGQAGGRGGITPEIIGINLREARIPDNEGNMPSASPVIENAPAAYFSTVCVREMTEEIKKAGIPAYLSYSAGAFVCNDCLYTLLNAFHGTETKVGFIHVPFLPEQAKNGAPSLPIEEIVRALTIAVAAQAGA